MANDEKKTASVAEEAAEETLKNEETNEAAQPKEEVKEEKSELDKANEQIAGITDKLMRMAAEFDNYKKRTAREKDDFYKMAVCETVLPFLAVLDNLDRAVAAAEESGDSGSVLEGVKMIQKQFAEALTSVGVEAIDAVGGEFDPEKHNAVMTAESDEKENTVLEEFQKGYIYKDRVVRHSMVKVSS